MEFGEGVHHRRAHRERHDGRMRLVTDDGVGSRVERARFIHVPERVEIYHVLLEIVGQRIVHEFLVIDHLLLDLGRDDDLATGFLHPHRDEVLIYFCPPRIVGDVLRRRVERIELLRTTVIHAGTAGRVRAQLQRDEFLRLQPMLLQPAQRPLLVANVDAKAAVGGEFEHGWLYAGIPQHLECFRVAAVNEGRRAEQRPALLATGAGDHVGKVRLALKTPRFADLPAIDHEIRALPHAGTAQEKVGALNRPLHGSVFLGERPLHHLHVRETPLQHRVYLRVGVGRPEDDLRLRQILLEKTQRARRVADIADVLRRPRALQQDGFWSARGPACGGQGARAERSSGGLEERAASHHGDVRVRVPGKRCKSTWAIAPSRTGKLTYPASGASVASHRSFPNR